jgi:hypothetical protein
LNYEIFPSPFFLPLPLREWGGLRFFYFLPFLLKVRGEKEGAEEGLLFIV